MDWKVHAAAWMTSTIVAIAGIAITRNLDALAVMVFPSILFILEMLFDIDW